MFCKQCALVAKQAYSLLDCLRKTMASRLREVFFPPLSTGETCLKGYVQVWAAQYKRDINILGWLLWSATEIINGLGHFPYKKQLRQLELFCLEKGRFRVIFSMHINSWATCPPWSIFKQGNCTTWSLGVPPKLSCSVILYRHCLPNTVVS